MDYSQWGCKALDTTEWLTQTGPGPVRQQFAPFYGDLQNLRSHPPLFNGPKRGHQQRKSRVEVQNPNSI